jgi:hypothetical protein
MKPLLLVVCSMTAAWAAMTAIYLQSTAQRERLGLRPQSPAERRAFIAVASGLLVLSMVAAVTRDGPSFGLVLWLSQAGIFGLALLCLAPYAAIAGIKRGALISGLAAVLLSSLAFWL